MTRGFIMKSGTLARGEQLLLRELKILQYQIKTRQVNGSEAKSRGHQHIDRYFELFIREVEEEASEQKLGKVERENPELQERISTAKKDWSRIVDDLLAL